MDRNVLGLWFLVLGTTGIVNASIWNEYDGRNRRFHYPWHIPSNKMWHYREKWNYRPYLEYKHLLDLHDAHGLWDYEIDVEDVPESRQPIHLQKVEFANPGLRAVSGAPMPEMKQNEIETLPTDALNSLDKNTVNYVQDGRDEIRDNSYSNIESGTRGDGPMIKNRETWPDNPGNTILPNTDSTSAISFAPSTSSYKRLNLQLSGKQNTLKSSPESNFVTTSTTTLSSKTSLITNKRINGTNERSSSTLNSENKSFVSKTPLPTDNKNMLSTETLENLTDEYVSTNSEHITAETSFENETSENTSTLEVDSVTSKEPVSADSSPPHTTKNPADGSISSKVSSDISISYGTTPEIKETSENTPLHTESSSLIETQPTNSQISEKESTITPNPTSSTTSEAPLVTLTSKIAEETTEEVSITSSSTESESSNTEFTTESISEDHAIQISSIRTARVVISAVFLVIALIAVTVLAIYIFRVKRRAVEYDQLLLLP